MQAYYLLAAVPLKRCVSSGLLGLRPIDTEIHGREWSLRSFRTWGVTANYPTIECANIGAHIQELSLCGKCWHRLRWMPSRNEKQKVMNTYSVHCSSNLLSKENWIALDLMLIKASREQ